MFSNCDKGRTKGNKLKYKDLAEVKKAGLPGSLRNIPRGKLPDAMFFIAKNIRKAEISVGAYFKPRKPNNLR